MLGRTAGKRRRARTAARPSASGRHHAPAAAGGTSRQSSTRRSRSHRRTVDVHLQWYDNDSRPGLVRLWEDFRTEARRFPQRTLENLSYFMRKSGFSAMAETTLHPEYYCIGPVLENGVGAGSLLAGIILEIADPAFRIKLVRVMGEFALYDGDRAASAAGPQLSGLRGPRHRALRLLGPAHGCCASPRPPCSPRRSTATASAIS